MRPPPERSGLRLLVVVVLVALAVTAVLALVFRPYWDPYYVPGPVEPGKITMPQG